VLPRPACTAKSEGGRDHPVAAASKSSDSAPAYASVDDVVFGSDFFDSVFVGSDFFVPEPEPESLDDFFA